MKDKNTIKAVMNFIEVNAVDKAYLYDWYRHSVTDAPPVWTDEHIAELHGDFYLIPREVVERERESQNEKEL